MNARPRLGFVVDGVAALRQSRRARVPDPVEAALVAERAGADQICAHLWEDRRHIQDRDLEVLRKVVKTELALYLAASDEHLDIALSIRPDTVTLTPERAGALETEAGLDLVQAKEALIRQVRSLAEAGLRVSAVVDGSVDQVRAAHRLGLHAIEIHTGDYAVAVGYSERAQSVVRIRDAAKMAHKLGLGVSAAHGLNAHNVAPVARISEVQEVNVGHALCAAALIVGLEAAVKNFLGRIAEARAAL